MGCREVGAGGGDEAGVSGKGFCMSGCDIWIDSCGQLGATEGDLAKRITGPHLLFRRSPWHFLEGWKRWGLELRACRRHHVLRL